MSDSYDAKLVSFLSLNESSLDELCHKLMLLASDYGREVPILSVTLDLEKYNKEHKGSCMFHVIPDLQDDEHIKNTLFGLIDYIRTNYDCNKFLEV